MAMMDNETLESGDDADGHGELGIKPFFAHLEDLRKTVVFCAISLLIGMLIAFPFTADILTLLKEPMARAGADGADLLKVTKLAAGFSIAMRVIFWSGMLLSAPVMLFSIARFVFPGLTERERRAISRSLTASVGLFVGGVCMGFFMTVPVGIKVMMRITDKIGVSYDFIELADYVSFVLKMLLAFGLAFELPVVVLILGSLGILNSTSLREKRRHVFVGLLVLAMMLTPADPWTMLMMACPLIALFEVCIWLIWFKERSSKADATTD